MKRVGYFALMLTLIGLNSLFMTCAESSTTQIAAGYYHTAGLQDDHTVVAVGSNAYGQTDVGTWKNITGIAAGGYHTLGVTLSGDVQAVGLNNYNQIDVGSWQDITQVAAGTYHTVGLKKSKRVIATGLDDKGQLEVSSWADITQVTAGRNITAGLTSGKKVVTAGYYVSYDENVEYSVSNWPGVTMIAAGDSHLLGLTEDNEVVAVGSNDYGQLNVSFWEDIVAVYTRGNTSFGIKSDGSVVSTGSNLNGQRDVTTWSNIQSLAPGWTHTVGLTKSSAVIAVGANNAGQIETAPFNPGVTTYYLDSDGDGYGNPEEPLEDYTQPDGYVANSGDCDDSDNSIHPGAEDISWDGIDQNCDGEDNQSLYLFWYDGDLDGYGDSQYVYESKTKTAPFYYVSVTDGEAREDCNDNDENIHPGAEEIRGDGIDQNCDGVDPGVLTTYYEDFDQDGYGDPDNSLDAETTPDGYVTDNTDCDDSDETINPAAEEIPGNDIDENCDGITQELNVFYKDDDGDEYGDPENFVEARTQPEGYVANGLDCDDDNADINPGMDEICNGVDDNCDGTIDEGCCDSAPDIVTPISPAGSIVGTDPVFRWEENACASEYRILVFDSSNSAVARFTVEVEDTDPEIPDAVCTEGKCAYTLDTELDIDSYQWWIRGINYLGKGEWSSQDQGLAFDVPGENSPAFKPVLQDAVINTGSPSTTTILFKWNDVGNASWYRLMIQDAEGEEKIPNPDDKWFEALETCTLGDCNLTVTFSNDDLSAGEYQWDVKAWNDFGSQWSDAGSFTISP